MHVSSSVPDSDERRRDPPGRQQARSGDQRPRTIHNRAPDLSSATLADPTAGTGPRELSGGETPGQTRCNHEAGIFRSDGLGDRSRGVLR